MKKIFNEIMLTLTVMCIALVPMVAVAKVGFAANINNQLCSGASLTDPNQSGNCDSSSASTNVTNTVNWIINVFSWIVGVVSVIMIIYGGFKYITSSGNDANVTSAKNTIMYAIIGLVIVALAQLIVKFVIAKLGSVDNSQS